MHGHEEGFQRSMSSVVHQLRAFVFAETRLVYGATTRHIAT